MTDILRISVPLTVWLGTFSAVYGLHGLVCSERWHEATVDGLSAGRAALVAAWLLAIAFQVAFLVALRSPRFASRSTFVRGLSLTLAVAALVATVWTLFPVIATSICLPPSFTYEEVAPTNAQSSQASRSRLALQLRLLPI